MPAQSTVIVPGPLQSINATTFTGNYLPVGVALAHPARIIRFVNNTTVLVTISWDGVTDHDVLPTSSFLLLDIGTNKGSSSPSLEVQQGTQIFVKGADGTGFFYVAYYYGK